MAFGVTFFVVAALVIGIWILVELKKFRHQVFAFFLIAIILFTYLSFTVVLKNQDIKLNTISGVLSASKLYFSWLGGIFNNFKGITSNVLKMDWGVNESSTSNNKIKVRN